MLHRALFSLLLLLTVSSSHAAEQKTFSATSPHHLSAETCGTCHKQIFEQWKGSMHSQSSPLKDPIFAEAYKHVIGDATQEGLTKNGQYPVCLNCHAPNAAKDLKTKIDAQNYHEGVNCVVCHTLKDYKGTQTEKGNLRFGIQAYEVSPDRLQGPSGRYLSPEANAFHPFQMEPNQLMLRTSRVCMGCHEQFINDKGVPMCQTGMEYSDMNAPVTCQSCHMPKVGDSTDHSMLGGHSETMLKRAIVVSLKTKTEGNVIKTTVRLQNMLPHRFPTGVPFRNVYMKLTAYDKQDRLLFNNFKTFPPEAKDDPKAMFMYNLADETGKAVALPFSASEMLSDTRFKASELRELEYNIPAKDVAVIRAEVIYHLLTPEFVEKLGAGLTGDLTSPAVAGIAEVKF